MTSRERTFAALEHTGPDFLPLNFSNRDFELSDVLCNGAGGDRDFVPTEPGMTEWGFVWHSLNETFGQPKSRPLADWDNFATYKAPNAYAEGRFDHLPAWTEEKKDYFRRCSVGITGFNQATFLRGFEDFLMDMALYPERSEAVLDLVFDFENGLIEQMVKYDIDCVTFGDDWGTQQGLMIAPQQFKTIFKPRYKDQFARIKDAGKKIWFHCCGQVYDLIEDMIEIGVDVMELLQPDVFGTADIPGVERLARDFGGDVTFCCSVDHQRRALNSTPEEITEYVDYLVSTLGAFNGGFVANIEDYKCLGMSEETYLAIRESFLKYSDKTV